MASDSLFFHNAAMEAGAEVWLEEEAARHIIQVLRMRESEPLRLTNGKGTEAFCRIKQAQKKKCSVFIEKIVAHELPLTTLRMAIAFTKNTGRNEWLLEKITELGVTKIIPLKTTRSEREHIKQERWQNILISAMLQSQQYYLPELTALHSVQQVLETVEVPQKLIAHCNGDQKRGSLATVLKPGNETLIMIGPEGDFTKEEVMRCEAAKFTGISMGITRLRTETAAMTACAYFNMINNNE